MLWSLPFVLLLTLALPAMAIASRRHHLDGAATPQELPSRQSLGFQALATQAVVGGAAWLAAWGAELQVPWSGRWTLSAGLFALAVVATALTLAWLEGRRPQAMADPLRHHLRQVSPTNPLWLAVCGAAAVVEEYAYRGVFPLLLAGLLGMPAAVLLSALLFGLAHWAQGPRGAATSCLFGLVFQALVHLSGGLLLAMIVHLLYDFGASWLGWRLGRDARG